MDGPKANLGTLEIESSLMAVRASGMAVNLQHDRRAQGTSRWLQNHKPFQL